MLDGLIVDNFAGGGGASTGIEQGSGRSPDIAINHDMTALAMHEANHPTTQHLCTSVWKVDPDDIKGPIGLGWFSPDCKHFSKAKGGRPVEKGIRDLAWVVVRWARRHEGGPRVIILENVEEFRTWGPLGDDGKPHPDHKGDTFKEWVRELKRYGYKVEYRELRACDYGAPTIRKRLFLIARRDGKPIVWPAPTHGDPKSDEVKSGKLLPWRTAAEIIDWSLPCPSIFATSEEIMDQYGLRAVRPLKPATMARIAKGVKRYVLDAAKPFIVNLTHHGGERTESVDEPFMTVTGAHRGEKALVTPFVSAAQHGGSMRSASDPFHTVTASRKDQNQIIVPTLIQTGYGEREGQQPRVPGLDKPLGTAVAGGVKHAVVAPIITGVGGRMGQTEPRSADQPAQTITAKADSVLVAPHLTKFRANSIGSGMEEPAPTVTANSYIQRPVGAAPIGIVAPHLMTMRNAEKPFNEANKPTHTITAGGAHMHLVAAFMAKHFGGHESPGWPLESPASTVTAHDHHALVAANLAIHRGTGVGASLDEPARTATAGGQHQSLTAAFMQKYYGTDQDPQIEEPVHTATTKDRFGLVTVNIEGEPYVITDIGMRMLTPRELFRAQGFPETYRIDRKPDGSPISKTDQVSKCGNSVSPPMACALVAANCGDMAEIAEAAE